MKLTYIAPDIEVERYELNTSIAGNCTNVVSQGPEIGDHKACDEYDDNIWGDEFAISTFAARQTSFYDDGTCECYYSSSGEGLFTS